MKTPAAIMALNRARLADVYLLLSVLCWVIMIWVFVFYISKSTVIHSERFDDILLWGSIDYQNQTSFGRMALAMALIAAVTILSTIIYRIKDAMSRYMIAMAFMGITVIYTLYSFCSVMAAMSVL